MKKKVYGWMIFFGLLFGTTGVLAQVPEDENFLLEESVPVPMDETLPWANPNDSSVSAQAPSEASLPLAKPNNSSRVFTHPLDPIDLMLPKIKVIVYLLLCSAIIILTIFSIKRKGKVRITFKKEGKIVKKYVKLVFSDDKKVIFKDEKNRYECSPEEIIKIQKRNKSFIALLIVWGVFLIIGALDYLVYYATRGVNNEDIAFECFDSEY